MQFFHFRLFALEIIQQVPQLLNPVKLVHDMDNAVANGLGDVFQNAEYLYCTQHVQEADVRHLREIKRIMSDINGAHR